jgi:hypothetical protein
LRPARTPKGTEVRTVIKHVTKHLRRHWPNTRMVWRGDSHYGHVEAIEWTENDGVDYIFGLAGNATLDAQVAETADHPAESLILFATFSAGRSSLENISMNMPHFQRTSCCCSVSSNIIVAQDTKIPKIGIILQGGSW